MINVSAAAHISITYPLLRGSLGAGKKGKKVMERPIDISKKANVRCDHCDNWRRVGVGEGVCKIKHQKKTYYHRCKQFAWKKGGLYIDTSSGKTVVVIDPEFASNSMKNRRPVNISSPNNIKCEHCDHWTGWEEQMCRQKNKQRQYYQRCKQFAWKKGRKYISMSGGVIREVRIDEGKALPSSEGSGENASS